jgi:hypothetical protein
MRTRSLLLLAAASVVACSENNAPTTVVVGTDQVVAVSFANSVSQQAAVFWVVAESFDPIVSGVTVIDVNTAVTDIRTRLSGFFSPAGCINSSSGANRITFRAFDCAGPIGLNNTTGAVTALLDPIAGGVQIALSSSTLKTTTLNLFLDATAAYTASGNSRQLTVTDMANLMGQYTLSWNKGADCVNIDGSVSTLEDGPVQYTFTAFQACTTGCPRSGSVTRADPQTGVSITTSYNGTASVSFTKSTGESGTAILNCQ